MGREWELSYRLGMRKHKLFIVNKKFFININFQSLFKYACPKKYEKNISFELSELSRKRPSLKNFYIPKSQVFFNIIEERKKQKRNVYYEFIEKMKSKNQHYEPIFLTDSLNKKKILYS